MRPIIKQDVVVYALSDKLGMEEAKKMCEVLVSNSATIRSLSLKAIYFSFENIPEFDEGAVILVAKALLAMQNKVSIVAAFINYNDKQFPKLKTLFPNKSIPLFRNEMMANLLLGLRIPPLDQLIVYYETDGMIQTLISQELIAKGCKVIGVSTSKDFIAKRNQYKEKAFYLYDIFFDATGNFIPVSISGGIVTYTLYKKVDKNISLYFNTSAYNARVREGYKVFIFDATETKEFNLGVLDFIMSLALNNTSFETCICICGLKTTIDKDKIALCNRSRILFFNSVDECKRHPKIAEFARAYTTKQQSRKGLTKQLVAQLPVFIDASIETLSSLTGGNAKKTDYKVTQYKQSGQSNIMGALIGFEGDMSGIVALSFSRTIVKEASMMLLGEETDNNEELLDVISEFANIIAGRSKAILAEQNISITISLPKTCQEESMIVKELQDKQGVQVNLLLNEKPLILFLCH